MPAASGPLTRIMAIPPRPGAVDMAHIVSSKSCLSKSILACSQLGQAKLLNSFDISLKL